MTTDPFDIVREALDELKKYDELNGWGSFHYDKALAALDTIRDRYLPLEKLSEGWKLMEIKHRRGDDLYECLLECFGEREALGLGTTYRAAFLAAVRAIGGGE